MKIIFTSLFFIIFICNSHSQNSSYVNTASITGKNVNCGIGEIFVTKKIDVKKDNKEDKKNVSGTTNANLFPNPTENNLTIQCDEKIIKIIVFDNLGNELIMKEKGDLSVIDVSILSVGVYNLHIYLENKKDPKIKTFIKL